MKAFSRWSCFALTSPLASRIRSRWRALRFSAKGSQFFGITIIFGFFIICLEDRVP